jgi:hypothetical protein
VYSIGRTKWLVKAIETANCIDETLKLFRNNHSRKNCPVIWFFYACSPDVKPEGNAAGNNWHLDLYDGKELLEENVTRSKTLKFSFSTKELEDEEEEHTRKKMKPQNQEKGAPGIMQHHWQMSTSHLIHWFHHWLVLVCPLAPLQNLIGSHQKQKNCSIQKTMKCQL